MTVVSHSDNVASFPLALALSVRSCSFRIGERGRSSCPAPVRRTGWCFPSITLILGLIVSRMAIHLALASTYLHRAPIEPYLIMLAAVAVAGLVGADEPAA